MGQVYRADDLKLGQPVALKFLPDRLARDSAALARFHNEVKLARHISHPNVCRVFDIGEVDGQHFLSMEYIDGEDLASLIRRIGRLPHDKAVEVARQLCAGLAAAHDAGLLHRDIKPANVMLDGRGRARITDFGLAGVEAEIAGADVGSGTPAYMAPEQLAGREVTRRSDFYALGLVLFEIFTGKQAFEANGWADPQRLRDRTAPTRPSHWIPDLDPAVERVILRCLETDPGERPSSALEIAAALPGGNALDAALLAGETPSPEMVAAAPAAGALRPAVAGGCLAGVLLLLVLLSIGDRVNLHQLAPLHTSPVILADRAAQLAVQLGYRQAPADRASGFSIDDSWIAWAGDPAPAPARWLRISTGQPLTYYFWYRQSPVPLVPLEHGSPAIVITQTDPAPTVPGMVTIVLDPRGRLVAFHAVPDQDIPTAGATPVVDWGPLFAAAGLDMASFSPSPSRWTPAVFADETQAWVGTYADHPDLPLRIEAAAAHGRVVRYQVIGPWETPTSRAQLLAVSGDFAAVALLTAVIIGILVGGLVMARNNLRAGRGDLTGARKVAVLAGMTTGLAVVIGSQLPATFEGSLRMLVEPSSTALFSAGTSWLLYLALEPFIRSTRPSLMISWNRMLAGRLTDPMVGRDLLVGGLLALVGAGAFCLSGWVKVWTHHPFGPNYAMDLKGFGTVLGSAELVLLSVNPTLALAALVFLSLIAKVVRSFWMAAAILAALAIGGFILFSARSWPTMGAMAVLVSLGVVSVAKYGLLSGISWVLFTNLSLSSALTTDFSLWSADAVVFRLAIMIGIAVFGFWTARARLPVSRSTSALLVTVAALVAVSACGARRPGSPASPTPTTPTTLTVPIMGASRLTPAQLAAWFNTRTPRPAGVYGATVPVETLAQFFVSEGAAEGVTGDVAFMQSIVETGWFRFAGSVPASYNNFAGVGATDSNPSPAIFPDARTGVRAQIQHLRAYADPTALTCTVPPLANPCVDPRFSLVLPKGRAPTWNQMGNGNWASASTYASSILTLFAEALASHGLQ
jgi:serine/threonine-protein kinase